MRDHLDEILEFIGAEPLTDEEFTNTQPLDADAGDYTLPVYEALQAMLTGRESLSSELTKLSHYFQAKGLELTTSEARDPSSQILVGVTL